MLTISAPAILILAKQSLIGSISPTFKIKDTHTHRYGLNQFILIAPDEHSEALLSEAQTKLLLSSVSPTPMASGGLCDRENKSRFAWLPVYHVGDDFRRYQRLC